VRTSLSLAVTLRKEGQGLQGRHLNGLSASAMLPTATNSVNTIFRVPDAVRIADSSSINALNISSARIMKRFRHRDAHRQSIVRRLRPTAEYTDSNSSRLCGDLPAMISQYFMRPQSASFALHSAMRKCYSHEGAMREIKHVYEVRPRKDKRGVDLFSDALPFGQPISPMSTAPI
jgi:hypothetical protein